MADSLPSTMKAVRFHSYGGGPSALKLEDVPVLTPSSKELLIKVGATAVNGLDWKVQSGSLKLFMPIKLPFCPGLDVAGEVVAAGSDVLSTDFAVGDRVVAFLDAKTAGASAEYAILPTALTAKIPASIAIEDAASLPLVAVCAYNALVTVGGMTMDGYKGNVLILAASGGVGLFAVQLAKLAGAHVTVTASPRNFALLKSLGADELLDYKALPGPPGNRYQSPSGHSYDLVLDGTPTGTPYGQLKNSLASTAKQMVLIPSLWAVAAGALSALPLFTHKVFVVMTNPNGAQLKEVASMLAAEKLKVVVDTRYEGLEKLGEAWTANMEGHAVGKLVVVVP